MSPADDSADRVRPGVTRRRLLEGSVALAGVGVLGSLAGCSTASGADQPAYATWLPRPETIYDPESGGSDTTETRVAPSTEYLPFQAATYDGIAEYAARNDTEYAPPGRPGSLHPVVDLWVDNVSFAVWSSRGFQVSETSLDREQIVAAFEEHGFEPDGTYEGYQTLTTSESPWVVAVDGGRFVEAWQPEGFPAEFHAPSRTVQWLVDSGAGRRDGLVEAEDGVAALTERLGMATRLAGETYERVTESDPEIGQFRGQVAEGTARDVDGATTELRHVLVFASDTDVPAEEIEVWADPDRQSEVNYFDEWSDVVVSTAGQTAVVEGTVDTAEAFEWGDPFDSPSTPATTAGSTE